MSATIDIYSTYFMLACIREKGPVYSFLKDRYFPQSEEFKTEKVFVDYDDGEGNLMAPFVIPRVGKVPMERTGYETRELSPAYIAPSRPLSIDILERRLAGESLVSTLTPDQRERVYLMDDLDFLDRAISRREEWMCANTLLKNACHMEHVGDRIDDTKKIAMDVYYYDVDSSGNGDNPGVFTPSAKWAVGTAAKRGIWYNDVCAQVENLYLNGRNVTDLVVGPDVGDLILNDPWVISMLDNRRIELGTVDPRWQENGVVYLGRLNFAGVMLDIFIYRGSYQTKNNSGKLTTVPYFPRAAVLLAAPSTGIIRYGSVTQVEMDKQTYTRTGKRIPKHLADENSNQKETVLTARPIASPVMKSPWRACENVLETS